MSMMPMPGEITVKLKLTRDMTPPEYATDGSAAVDLRAALDEGETVVLDTGESAIAYIRARSELVDGSNITRMARQEAFLRAFFSKLGERQFSESELITLYDEVRPYVCNDAGDAGYEVFFNMIKEYSVGETVSLKGAATKGKGGYIEFYVNEEHVKEVMLDVFYDKAKK